ncbi:hypothetical protein A0256_22335 [Mucilaginibacter sp. PAMC 26640]|nr:hypothetical protein A0256_22335 [Mucilaginibacter sp. PAMC 26640]
MKLNIVKLEVLLVTKVIVIILPIQHQSPFTGLAFFNGNFQQTVIVNLNYLFFWRSGIQLKQAGPAFKGVIKIEFQRFHSKRLRMDTNMRNLHGRKNDEEHKLG